MVFGGRRPMAVPVALNERQKASFADHDTMDVYKHHGMFEDDPEFHMWLEDPDPIVIECEDGFGSQMRACDFRLHSHSFGEQTYYEKIHRTKLTAKFPSRRTWSESCLALNVPSQKKVLPISLSCPCESVQGIYSHGTCPAADSTAETCCFTCGSDWASDHTSWACFECGGYGLERSCASCNGKCGEKWKRDLKLTHSTGEASWGGKCGLGKENDSQQDCMMKPEPGIQ